MYHFDRIIVMLLKVIAGYSIFMGTGYILYAAQNGPGLSQIVSLFFWVIIGLYPFILTPNMFGWSIVLDLFF